MDSGDGGGGGVAGGEWVRGLGGVAPVSIFPSLKTLFIAGRDITELEPTNGNF